MGKIVNRLEEGVIALLLAGMTSITFLQVVLRYVFNSSITWAFELTTVLFAWLVLFGISYGVKVGSHIGVDALVKTLPVWAQKICGLLGVALSLLYAGIVVTGGWQYLSTMRMLGAEMHDLPVPVWIPLIILPLGFVLLGVRMLQVGVAILSGRQTKLNLADEAADAIQSLGATIERDEPKEIAR